MAKRKFSKIAVIDFETDPFKFGRVPQPFCAEFFDGTNTLQFWGKYCAKDLIAYIDSLPEPHLIYAHNGGKFDFHYLLREKVLENPMLIIHGRIVKCAMLGRHELRDSYAILPLALDKLGDGETEKLEIDYAKFEKGKREKYKKEILHYLHYDCAVLFNVVSAFRERFGNKLTVAATAIGELGKLHYVARRDMKHDKKFRPFYFGGRVECFEAGELLPDPGREFQVFDVNSMYPAVMKNYKHPASGVYIHLKKSDAYKMNPLTGKINGFIDDVYFARIIAGNKGALPIRKPEGGLDFNCPYGEFYACSHEIKAALELGLIKIDEILDVYIPSQCDSFGAYVDTFIAEKIQAKKDNNKMAETFSKLMLNSAYGKFAIDPLRFTETFIYDELGDEEETAEFAEWKEQHEPIYCALAQAMGLGFLLNPGAQPVMFLDHFQMWEAPAPDEKGFYDVAVAASITSAARSVLLRAIHSADRPLYCDTDSLICQDLTGARLDEYDLGAWKFEGMTDKIYIAGKKMYAAKVTIWDNKKQAYVIKDKIASKGAKLDYDDIAALCKGQTIHWKNDAPNFKLTGDVKFVERNIVRNA